MMKQTVPFFVVSISSASLLQATILSEDFTGGLTGAFWDKNGFAENNGVITPVNDQLEFSAASAAELFDSNHFAGISASSVVSGNESWSIDVTSYLAPVGDFGSFGLFEATALTLSLENTNDSQDNLEVSFAAGDPFGTGSSDKQIRAGFKNAGVEEGELLSGLLGSVGATDLSLDFDHTTGLVTIAYNTGGGEIVLGSQDLSSWDFDSQKNLTVSLGGGAFHTGTTIQSGTFEVLSGEAYFDNLTIHTGTDCVPEPTSAILSVLGFAALLRRRR